MQSDMVQLPTHMVGWNRFRIWSLQQFTGYAASVPAFCSNLHCSCLQCKFPRQSGLRQLLQQCFNRLLLANHSNNYVSFYTTNCQFLQTMYVQMLYLKKSAYLFFQIKNSLTFAVRKKRFINANY